MPSIAPSNMSPRMRKQIRTAYGNTEEKYITWRKGKDQYKTEFFIWSSYLWQTNYKGYINKESYINTLKG